jgi:hypothetical protein
MEPLTVTSILGLPAHPLFAHIPVVLIPLAAIGAVLMLWSGLRDRVGWFVVGIVFVAGIATQLAITSGQNLKEYVRETQLMRDHIRMGENIRPWVLLMFLALLGVMLVARRAGSVGSEASGSPGEPGTEGRSLWGGRDGLKIAGVVLAVLSIVFSVIATYSIFQIGHSGSKAVWEPTQVKIDKGATDSGHEGGDG